MSDINPSAPGGSASALATTRRTVRAIREFLRDRRDKGKRLEFLQRVVREIWPGYRLTWPGSDWWDDEAFNAYLRTSGEAEGLNTHNRFTLAQLLRLVSHVPGDTAECGVYRGASSRLILMANRASEASKTHHLFDSFEGLSRPAGVDGEHWSGGDLRCGIGEVRNNLREFDADLEFHPGWIPGRFDDVADRRFSFVHIDVDLRDPTRDSLEFFYPRMSEGGIIVCDDYGSAVCPGATEACDRFLHDRPEAMIAMPAAGGFLIRGCPVADRFW